MYWDNFSLREQAILTIDYITGHGRALVDNLNSINGPVFQIFIYLPEFLLKLTNVQQAMLSRIMMNFFLFWIGILIFWFFVFYIFRSWAVALLGVVFMMLTPRVFGDSFANVKDIGIMVMFIASFFTMMRFLDNKSLWNSALHAITTAILISTRIHGVLIPIITVFFVLLDIICVKKERERFVEILTGVFLYFFILIPAAVLMWPYLWEDPAGRFMHAFSGNLSQNLYEEPTLYFGKLYIPRNVPWHYTFVWIFITTPILYLVFMVSGMTYSIKKVINSLFTDYKTARMHMIIWSWVIVSFMLPIVLAMPLYHGWRHHLFVYPALVLLMLFGFKAVCGWTGKKRLVTVLTIFLLSCIAFEMVQYHPYQYLYFNSLVGGPKGAKFKFELDYEGATYRGALEYILRTDPRPKISIRVQDITGRWQSYLLSENQIKRMFIHMDSKLPADYYIGAYSTQTSKFPYDDKCYSVNISGVPIAEVYKIR